ncbi:MAG: dihydroorotate dehydrogenase electron transfer subunit [Thermodesulfovibrionia bacterium]
MSRIFTALIKENRNIKSNHYLLTLHPLKRIIKPQPGQFFMVSVGNTLDPLLKRPFSLYRWLDGDFQILYRVVGKGTEMLSKRMAGEGIDVIGPLGNGFPLRHPKGGIILIAGGLGIAPIFALAEAISKKGPLLFYGAKTGGDLLNLHELKGMCAKVIISTDDGSHGYKGMITEQLRGFLSNHESSITDYLLYACGPLAML